MFNITVYSKEIYEYHISKTAYVVVREGGGGGGPGVVLVKRRKTN